MKYLFALFLLPVAGFSSSQEILTSNFLCKGPFMMLPEVSKKYPRGIVIKATYDKLFKNHDVSINLNGKETLEAVRFYSDPKSCRIDGRDITVSFDCGTKKFQEGSLRIGDRSFIHLNCDL
jgi:hypothetical protein